MAIPQILGAEAAHVRAGQFLVAIERALTFLDGQATRLERLGTPLAGDTTDPLHELRVQVGLARHEVLGLYAKALERIQAQAVADVVQIQSDARAAFARAFHEEEAS